jgi:hypothetical protein
MRIIGYLTYFVLAAVSPIKAWAEPIGWMTAGTETVRARSGKGTGIFAQDVLGTETDAKMKALMKGDTVLTLAGATQLQVDKGKTTLRRGIVRALVGMEPYEVQTETARASTSGGYFITWSTECEGNPATGVLALSGNVTASDPKGIHKVALTSDYYTYIGADCPNPVPLPASSALYAGLVSATELNDQVRAVVSEISEGAQIDTQEKGVPIFFPQPRRRAPSVPPIAQTGPLFLLTRVRVNIDFR